MSNMLVNRIIPVFLFVMAVAVGLNLILTPVYHDGSDNYVIWKIMNWPMAVGVAIALIASCVRHRAAKRKDPDSMGSLRASLVFYGAIVLAIIFYWNWIWTLNPDSETGGAVTSHLVYFPIMDALFVALALSVGRRLWREVGSPQA
jgi:hypothetical protein